jgi:hypothetical protein
MRAAARGSIEDKVRRSLTREGVHDLMKALARSAPSRGSYRVFFVGGGTAVLAGWRVSTIDADLYSDTEAIFRDVQAIKERLQLSIEFARPEDFVPAQLLSKVVRGFNRDMLDAASFVDSGMVDPKRFRSLVNGISETAYGKYPALSRRAVLDAVDGFLSRRGS